MKDQTMKTLCTALGLSLGLSTCLWLNPAWAQASLNWFDGQNTRQTSANELGSQTGQLSLITQPSRHAEAVKALEQLGYRPQATGASNQITLSFPSPEEALAASLRMQSVPGLVKIEPVRRLSLQTR